MEKYGVPYATQNPQIMEKLRETNTERYGAPYILQMDGFKDKTKENMTEKFGSLEAFYAYVYDCAIKSLAKHRKNGGKTEIEQLTYEYLVDIFGEDDVVYNSLIDERYPFHVDFYIKSRDVFIEINAFWTHGEHRFNPNDESDVKLLDEWKNKSENSKKYKIAVDTWSEKDVLKINTAEENGLYYIPIWSNDIGVVKETIEQYFKNNNLEFPRERPLF